MNMDQAILTSFPLLPVPTSSTLSAATSHGMRYLVGRLGVLREINLPWIRVIHSVANSILPLPYGMVDETVEFKCGRMPSDLIKSFVQDARAAFPNEAAAAFVWNENTGQWRYARREGVRVSSAHISYIEVRLAEGEHLVVDVHSHGGHPAFFSEEDDRDDAGAMKVSLVLGNLDQERPTSKMRLCMAGHVIQPAFLGADGTLGVGT